MVVFLWVFHDAITGFSLVNMYMKTIRITSECHEAVVAHHTLISLCVTLTHQFPHIDIPFPAPFKQDVDVLVLIYS